MNDGELARSRAVNIPEEAAALGSEIAKAADRAIARAIDFYFQTDGGDPSPWDEEAIGELGALVHSFDGTIEFHMGEMKLLTFKPLEMSVEIIYGAPLSMYKHEIIEHFA